jgi:hypothetical protein
VSMIVNMVAAVKASAIFILKFSSAYYFCVAVEATCWSGSEVRP